MKYWVFVGLALISVGCRAPERGPDGRWPVVTAGCEQIELFNAGEAPSRPTRFVRQISGGWDEPDKDLRAWMINRACELGADAVIEVREKEMGAGDSHEWRIYGDAVVYTAQEGSTVVPPAPSTDTEAPSTEAAAPSAETEAPSTP